MSNTRRVHAVVFTVGATAQYKFANYSVATDNGQFYGQLLPIGAFTYTLGNLNSGQILSNAFTLDFQNPILKDGARLFKRIADLFANHQVLADVYEVIGDDEYIKTFSNWNVIIKGRVRIPHAKYIQGLDNEQVTITLDTALTEFPKSNVQLAEARGSFPLSSVPKTFGQQMIPAYFVGQTNTHLVFKACEGPVGSITDIRIDGGLPILLNSSDVWPQFGAFQIPLVEYGNYFLDYVPDYSAAPVTCVVDGYLNPSLRNDKWVTNYQINFGDQIRTPTTSTNASIVDNGDGTSRVTFTSASAISKALYWRNLPGFWGSQRVLMRIKYVSGSALGVPSIFKTLSFGSRKNPATANNNFLRWGTLTTGGSWEEIEIYPNNPNFIQNIFYQYDWKDWFRFYQTEFNLGLYRSTTFTNDLVVDIEWVKFQNEGLTTELVDQLEDMFISHTEEMGNVLSNSLGYGPYLKPTPYGEQGEAAVESEVNADAFIGSYVARLGVNPNEGDFDNDAMTFENIILQPDTEFVFSVRHSLLLQNYQRTSVRCWVMIENTDGVSTNWLLTTDQEKESWANSPANSDRHILNLVDPVHWNQSSIRFKTPVTPIANSTYTITVGFFDAEFIAAADAAVGRSDITVKENTAIVDTNAINAHLEGNVKMLVDGISKLTQSSTSQPNFLVLSSNIADDQYRLLTTGTVQLDSYPKISGQQNPSPTNFVLNSQLEIYTPVTINAASLRPYVLGIDDSFRNEAKQIFSSRYMDASASLSGELQQIYNETSALLFADETNTVKARLITKALFAGTIITLTDRDLMGPPVPQGDNDDVWKNNIHGFVDYRNDTGEFSYQVNDNHRVSLTTPVVDSIQFRWLLGVSNALQRLRSRVQRMDGVGRVIGTWPNDDIEFRWGMRDLTVRVGGNVTTQIQAGQAVRLTYETIDDIFIVKNVVNERIKDADIATLALSSMYSGGGANAAFAFNALVHAYGSILYSAEPPTGNKNHFS